jgi:hypothetical protein
MLVHASFKDDEGCLSRTEKRRRQLGVVEAVDTRKSFMFRLFTNSCSTSITELFATDDAKTVNLAVADRLDVSPNYNRVVLQFLDLEVTFRSLRRSAR